MSDQQAIKDAATLTINGPANINGMKYVNKEYALLKLQQLCVTGERKTIIEIFLNTLFR